ncbi:MAG: hypothetical protein QNJ47_07670 [Nostocaceae cyanobacterium]|nr:hypothetical protein [Nostocaceae cyanobacterium]
MAFNFKALGGLLVLFATLGFPSMATAQTQAPNYENTSDAFDRAFFKNDPTIYRNNTLRREIDWMFGPGSILKNSFPENEIARDAELVNIVYRDVLQQQTTSDPYIRTPDLPNPYNTSVMMSPRVNADQLQVGTEFRFEQVPNP